MTGRANLHPATQPGQPCVVWRTTLPAGRAVHRPTRPTRVAGVSSPGGHAAAGCAVNGRRRPTDQQTQGSVVGAFLRPLGQRPRVNRSEHGTSAGVHHGYHDLGSARHVEHDPVELWAAAGDLDEFAGACRLHRQSVLSPRDGTRARRDAPTARRQTAADQPVAAVRSLELRADPAVLEQVQCRPRGVHRRRRPRRGARRSARHRPRRILRVALSAPRDDPRLQAHTRRVQRRHREGEVGTRQLSPRDRCGARCPGADRGSNAGGRERQLLDAIGRQGRRVRSGDHPARRRV